MSAAVKATDPAHIVQDPLQVRNTNLKTHSGEFYIVRVDAPPTVEVPGGCFVTVESGPHTGLLQALHILANPKARAHTTPDIVFLPTTTTVWAKQEVVAAKPRLVVTSSALQAARDPRNDKSEPKKRKLNGPAPSTNPADPMHKPVGPPQPMYPRPVPNAQANFPGLPPQFQLRPQLMQTAPQLHPNAPGGQPPRLILPYGIQFGNMPPGAQGMQRMVQLPNGQLVMLPIAGIRPVGAAPGAPMMRPLVGLVAPQQGQQPAPAANGNNAVVQIAAPAPAGQIETPAPARPQSANPQETPTEQDKPEKSK